MATGNTSYQFPPYASENATNSVLIECDTEEIMDRLQQLGVCTDPALLLHTQIMVGLQFAETAVGNPTKATIEAALKQIDLLLKQEDMIPDDKKKLLKIAREHLISKERDITVSDEPQITDTSTPRTTGAIPKRRAPPVPFGNSGEDGQREISNDLNTNRKLFAHVPAQDIGSFNVTELENYLERSRVVNPRANNTNGNLSNRANDLMGTYNTNFNSTYVARDYMQDLQNPLTGVERSDRDVNSNQVDFDGSNRCPQISGNNNLLHNSEQIERRLPGPEINSYPFINPDSNPTVRRMQNEQTPSQRNKDSGWMFSLHQALNTIPHYDGNPDMLALFCRAVRDVIREFGPSSERWVLNSLASKFRGRAADGYTPRLTQYDTVERLLADLTTQYSGVGGADKVLADLKVIRQYVGESAGDYGLRVQTLHNRLLNIYDASRDMYIWEKVTYKNNADKEALEQFLFGLNGELQHQVRSKNPTCLREAITEAVAFEHRTSARRAYGYQPDVSREDNAKMPPWAAELLSLAKTAYEAKTVANPQSGTSIANETVRYTMGQNICNYCRKQGHNEQDCKTKNFETKKCEYCNLAGHTYAECFSLKNAITNGQLSKEKFEKQASALSATASPVVYTPFPIAAPAPVPYVVPATQQNETQQSNITSQQNGNNNGKQGNGNRRGNVRRYSGERNNNDNKNFRNDYKGRGDNWNYNNRSDDRGYDNRRYDRGYDNRRNDRDFDNRRNDRNFDNRRNNGRYNNGNDNYYNDNRYNGGANYDSRNNDRNRSRQDNGNFRNQSDNSLNSQDARYQSGVSGNR